MGADYPDLRKEPNFIFTRDHQVPRAEGNKEAINEHWKGKNSASLNKGDRKLPNPSKVSCKM